MCPGLIKQAGGIHAHAVHQIAKGRLILVHRTDYFGEEEVTNP